MSCWQVPWPAGADQRGLSGEGMPQPDSGLSTLPELHFLKCLKNSKLNETTSVEDQPQLTCRGALPLTKQCQLWRCHLIQRDCLMSEDDPVFHQPAAPCALCDGWGTSACARVSCLVTSYSSLYGGLGRSRWGRLRQEVVLQGLCHQFPW